VPEVTRKHNESCFTSGSFRGLVHDRVAMVPAWHLRHRPLVAMAAAGVLESNA
jgi:hypothetical protein